MNEKMSRRNKKEVDRYVSQIPEKEKSSRGYQIALLYHEAGDYETAKRYLASYISTKETIPQAHKLMGQILESSNNKEQAITSYRRSLELDGKQTDLILKICELFSGLKTVDQGKLKYWIEQAERHHPNSSVVFKLKERQLSGGNLEDMEDFYAKQLVKNYTDVNLHIKLLDLYMNGDKVDSAYRHTIDVEKTQAFSDNIIWYENVNRIFQAYYRKERCKTDTSFHTHRLIVLCNLVYLQIKEKEIVSCSQSLYMLDQCLMEATMLKSQKQEWTAILSEVQGMFYFLCGLLLMKRANKGQLSWKDSTSFSLVCFLLSNSFPAINRTSSWYTQAKSVQLHKFYDRIHLFGCYRLSQTGYVIKSLLKGESATQLNAQKQQLRTPQARDKLYDIMFTMREMREKKGLSYLMLSGSYCSAQIVTPSKKSIQENDSSVYELFAGNLQQLVWLALQKYSVKDQHHPEYMLNAYSKFQFSTDIVDGSSLESLCQLDIQAFFLATVRCASIKYEEQHRLVRRDQFRPFILPVCLCPSLCTSQQTDWWTAMYKFCTGKAKENFGKLRATIQRGLEVVRLQGTHGMSIVTIANIARTFDQRAKELERIETDQSQDRLHSFSERAALYWKEANNILERMERKAFPRMPKERIFDDGGSGILDTNQIHDLKDQATFSLATTAMRNGLYEEAKDKFESVKTPWSSYYLAKIFRDMSDQMNSDDTGMADQKLRLMERSLDTLYLTLDRLKTKKNHDLEKIVPAEIDDVVNELERLRMPGIALVDSICNGMNGMSNLQNLDEDEDETSEEEEEYTSFNTPQGREEPHILSNPSGISPSFVASTPAAYRTPAKSPRSSKLQFSMEVNKHARPSPERLEARIWALEKKQETVIDLVQDMKNQNSELKQAVKDLKDEYGDLIKQVKELVLSQRPPQQMFPSPFTGSMYRPPAAPQYPFQPTPPMMPQSAYGYPLPMSPGPASRPIPSRIGRVNHYTQPNDVDEDFYEGDFYEDDGSTPGLYGQDTSGWTVNHKPGYEGSSTLGFPPQTQQMPPAGFFAQALRGQALQFQQGQILTGQANKQPSNLIGAGLLSVSSAQGANTGMFSGTQSQPAGATIPGTFPVVGSQFPQPQPAVAVPNRFPVPTPASSTIPDKAPGQLAALLASNLSPSPNASEIKAPVLSKPSDVQRSIFGTSPAAATPGTVNSAANTQTPLPLLSSLMAASTSPDKPLANPPVSMVTSVAPKGSFSFGQSTSTTGTKSPFTFGQVTSTTLGTGTNLFTSIQKQPSPAATNLFSSPQKENITTKPVSREASPIKSPSKTSEDHLDEYEPNVDFKPVIALPDLVETKTGEEDEEAMFCERAKLFRFDDGQWKERGVGEFKLLRHNETKRIRLLMRRDQVLKICANHFLTKDMKLAPMAASTKAWCWHAQDFSEGEIKVEKLAVRFKDEDLAKKFKSMFEKLQSEIVEGPANQPKKEQAKPVSTGQPSLGSLFKKEQGSWSCDACLVNNKAEALRCISCQALKPGVKAEDIPKTDTKGQSFSFGTSTGGFKIGNTASDQTPSGFKFQSGTQGTGGFTFGKTDQTKPDSTTGKTGFKFGEQTIPTPKVESDTSKPPLSAGFKFGQLPQSEKGKTEPKGFVFGETPAADKKSEISKQDQPLADSTKSSPVIKPAGFSFGGGTSPSSTVGTKPPSTFTVKPSVIASEASSSKDSNNSKPTSTFTFKPSTPSASPVTQKSIAKPEPTKTDVKKGFGDLFKPKEGSWSCTGCLVTNNGDVLKCPACQTLKPGVKPEDIKDTTKPAFGGGFTFGSKSDAKPVSGFSFTTDTSKDKSVSQPSSGLGFTPTSSDSKPLSGFSFTSTSNAKPTTGFSFAPTTQSQPISTDSKATSGFSFTPSTQSKPTSGFGLTPAATDAKPASGFSFTSSTTDSKLSSDNSSTLSDAARNQPNTEVKGFDFTLTPTKTDTGKSGSGFSFTFSPSKGGAAGPQSPPTDPEGMYVNKEGEDDHIYFEPVIELPSIVDVVTGEEDEEVLYQQRAKLFRFVDGEWKERGIGDIKIAKHKESGKIRLLMRREQILKICLNHYLSKELDLKPMPKADGKAWVWFAMDSSDGEPTLQQLAVRFKTQEFAANFKKAFDNARDNLLDSSTKKSPTKSEITGEKSDSTNDVIFIKEERATEEQIKMARKYQLPDHFYLYELKPNCPGCIGCEDYEPGKKYSPPKHKGQAKDTEKPSTAKPNVFGQNTLFGQKSDGGLFTASSTSKPGSVFGSAETSSSTSAVTGGVFGIGAGGGASIATATGGMFGGGGGSSFADLASQATSSTSPGFKVIDHNKQFSWTGAGQKLFAGAGDHGDAGDGEDDGNDDNVATYDPHYEPIIDLPELVEVKTGEEEYDKLFCQRAKLFRFDKDVKQWKEKGIGEMKILQHQEDRRYRLILRRDQVFKIACNQWLTPEVSFKPLPTSETSWCWVGQDFSDNEPVIEQLAIKFKTIDLANQFKETIDKCQLELRQRGSAASEKGDADKIPVTVAQQPEEDVKHEEQEEEDDDDEEYTTEEEEILFEKRITFFSKEDNWKAVGLGTIKVIYDEDVNGNRIMVELDSKTVVCNHLVAKETSLIVNKKDCQWSPIDFSTDEPLRRNFRAQFSSEQAAAEFNNLVLEGRKLAIESDISERNLVTYPREITFPEVHGGSSQ